MTRWWLLIACLLGCGVAAAQTGPAVTPYSVLYRALAPVQAMGGFRYLVPLQRIESKLPGVTPAQIRLVIHTRAGDLNVTVQPDGSLNFPLTPELMAEDPPVASNQPKGSLTLSNTLSLRNPSSLRFPAGEIVAGLREVEQVLAHEGSAPARAVRGVEFRFEPGSGAGLTLHGGSERYLMASADGRIVLIRDGDLGNGVTEIELTRLPVVILPYLGR